MKPSILLVLTLCLFACKSEDERNKEKLTKAIRQRIEDYAFKLNAKVELLEINSVTYKKVSQSSIDTLTMIYDIGRSKAMSEMMKSYNDVGKSKGRIAVLEARMNDFDESKHYQNEMHENFEKGRLYYDSVLYYGRKDSLLELAIKNRKAPPKDFFKAQFYCKARIGNENILDTLQLIFDKNFHFVDTKKEP